MHATTGEAVTNSAYPRGDEISIGDLLRIMWRERWTILLTTALGALLAGGISLIVRDKYEASVLLLPVTSQQGSSALGSITSAVSQLPGVGSLMSLSGLSTGGSNRAESIATLQSEVLTERYIRENDLLPILFARKWDAASKSWKVSDPDDRPTPWKGSRYIREHVRTISEDNKTGLVLLTMTWTDPRLAAQWANGLVELTNDYLRDKALRDSESHIAYLRSQIDTTSDVELKNVIYSLIESEIKKAMMARGDAEYALKVVDAAVVPEKPSSPKRWLWTLAGALIGFGLSLGAGLIRNRPG